MSNRILIIGSGGYIGQRLTDALSKNRKIKVFGPSVLDQNFLNQKNIKVFKGSILDANELAGVIEPGDIVVNLAGVTTAENDTDQQFKLNVLAQNILLGECVRKKVNKIIFISTINIYKPLKRASKEGDPLLPSDTYSLTKMIAEEVYSFYSRVYNIPTIVLRLGSVLGPDQPKGIIFSYARTIKDKKQIIVPKKNTYRDFIYIDDVVEAITDAIFYSLKSSENIEFFNISSGQRISLKDLALNVKKLVWDPINIVFAKKDPQLIQTWVNTSRAKKLLGFKSKNKITNNLKKILFSYNIS
jgi:nucleoside-diphosphate-sugar epimerase